MGSFRKCPRCKNAEQWKTNANCDRCGKGLLPGVADMTMEATKQATPPIATKPVPESVKLAAIVVQQAPQQEKIRERKNENEKKREKDPLTIPENHYDLPITTAQPKKGNAAMNQIAKQVSVKIRNKDYQLVSADGRSIIVHPPELPGPNADGQSPKTENNQWIRRYGIVDAKGQPEFVGKEAIVLYHLPKEYAAAVIKDANGVDQLWTVAPIPKVIAPVVAKGNMAVSAPPAVAKQAKAPAVDATPSVPDAPAASAPEKKEDAKEPIAAGAAASAKPGNPTLSKRAQKKLDKASKK